MASDEEGTGDRNPGFPSRCRPPLVHGLLIAVGFLAAWYGPGLVGVLEPSTGDDPGSPDTLTGLGYLSGLEDPPEDSGVLVHTNRAQPGYNLWTSGHKPTVYLSDLNGNVRHRWSVRFQDAFPDADLPPETYEVVSRDFIRKFHPYPDGTLLVMFTPYGMVKLGKDSRIQWSVDDVNHHDLAVAGDTIYSLTNDLKTVTHKGRTRTRIVDYITAYDAAGSKQRSWSVLEAIRGSDFESLLGYVDANENDMTHANSLKMLPDGHALLSLRTPNAIVEIDLNENRVPGAWRDERTSSTTLARCRTGPSWSSTTAFTGGSPGPSSSTAPDKKCSGRMDGEKASTSTHGAAARHSPLETGTC